MAAMLRIETEDNAVILPVKIVPGASRTRYLGEWEGCARFAVASPPEKGRANRELVSFLAELLGVRRQVVEVITGHANPRKRVRIGGVSRPDVLAALTRAAQR
jgi:uncharacterized protein (TIGR00251 family)